MKSIITLLLIVLTLSANSQSKKWKTIHADDNATLSYDTTDIEKYGIMISARIKSLPAKIELEKRKAEYQGLYGPYKYDFTNYSYNISKIEYDCTAKKFRHVYISFYDTRGETILAIYNQNEWYDVNPKTISEIAFKTVCALNR